MVKKYHQTRHDREDESRGMHRYWAEHSGGMDTQFYGMIKEDHSEPSNLPQEVVHKYYPKTDYMNAFELDDTARGLDDTRREDIKDIEHHHSDSKW